MATLRRRVGPRGVRWQAIIRLADCEPQRRTFPSREEAREWSRTEEAKLERLRRHGLGHTASDAIERYIHTAFTERSPSTRREGLRLLRWWHERIGHLAISAVTADVLVEARDEIKARASGPTANRYIAAISAVLKRAWREWGWIPENPAGRVERAREAPGRVRWLTQEEIGRLLAACTTSGRPELRTLVVMALATGMRQGEILGLRWDDVDLGRRLFVLHHTKNRERRGIPISAALVDELRALPRRIDSPLLFPPAQPGSVDPWPTYRKPWRRALAEAGIADFRFHDLRHTAASYLAMNGATEREIAEVLGHRTLQMVCRYSHLSREHLAGVMDRLATQVLPPARSHRSSSRADGE